MGTLIATSRREVVASCYSARSIDRKLIYSPAKTERRLLTSLKPLISSDAVAAVDRPLASVGVIKCSHVICGDIIQQRDVIFGLC